MEKSGLGNDGIFQSLHPPLVLPKDQNLLMISFLFRNSFSYSHKPAFIAGESSHTLSFSKFKSKVIQVSHGLINLVSRKTTSCSFSPPTQSNSLFVSLGLSRLELLPPPSI
ncbi:hypothetical protein ACFX1Z_006649 [Malus domestica]